MSAGRGEWPEYFSHTDGSKVNRSILEGIDFSWARIGAPKISGMIDAIIRNYKVDQPVRSVPSLVALYKEMKKLPAGYWPAQKLKEVQEIIAAASGMWMEATGGSALRRR